MKKFVHCNFDTPLSYFQHFDLNLPIPVASRFRLWFGRSHSPDSIYHAPNPLFCKIS